MGCNIDTYITNNQFQKQLFHATKDYLANFKEIRNTKNNSLGFLAVYGEKRLNEIFDEHERSRMKIEHNSYGLGKTHLQIAIALELINKGLSVLVVNDIPFMNELTQAQFINDDGEQLNKLLSSAKSAEVLIWDDMGKKKGSEHKQNLYYEIIDHRWRHRLPICFSSNEDLDTLADKIGDASASRLISMCLNRLVSVEGPDYRLR